jgi:concanavalin A-like lectin/glucanase superfamily protein
MADPWELILYHTYTGTPGVVFDQSPGRGSHGVAVNIADGDFLSDGASPGSGAVNFQPDSMIRVPATMNWHPLGGLRAEVVCIRDGASPVDVMIDGGSFRFYLRGNGFGAWFSSSPYQYAEIRSQFDGFDPTFNVPAGQWMTLGFMHDGASTMELSFNGSTVARVNNPLWPINPATSVTIGNHNTGGAAGTSGMSGRIDDVKIWRINPHRVDEEFTGRPVDESVKECWAEWTRALGVVLKENRDCAIRLRALLVRAVDSLIRDGLNHGDQTRGRWQAASDTYRQLWSEGNLADIVPMMADLVSYLQLTGLDPTQNPDVVALFNDNCLQTILGQAPQMDCDSQFSYMIGDLANTIEHRNSNQYITNQDRGV